MDSVTTTDLIASLATDKRVCSVGALKDAKEGGRSPMLLFAAHTAGVPIRS